MAEVANDFEEGRPRAKGSDNELVVDVGGFEGPIDVLLTLAREQKVDITQISIVELADQYLAWVARVRRHSLELAADYLVMAAWLAYLKSRLLLPDLSSDEEPSGEEMAEALAFQLRRLEAIQDAGVRLFARAQLGQDFFHRGAPEKFGYVSSSEWEVSLYDLLDAYGDQLHRSHIRTLRIEPSSLYSPDSMVKLLSDMLGKIPDWSDLMRFLPQEFSGDIISRSALASTFSAALQLTKEGKLTIRQSENFGPILVRDAARPELSSDENREMTKL